MIMINRPFSFDIETTSFYQNGEKMATMYLWAFSDDGDVSFGRTWPEFIDFLSKIKEKYGVNNKNKMVIWVHNLTYEFQFMRLWFEWDRVFALKEYEVLYAETDGVVFRCSHKYSSLSLEKLAENLTKYKIRKLKEIMDYDAIRHNKTVLAPEVYEYTKNDVLILTNFIKEEIEYYGHIDNLPLTATGKVREFCREKCFKGKKPQETQYFKQIKELTINDVKLMKQLEAAFCGGHTHGNFNYIGDVLENVKSYDETSAYPAVCVLEKFPMSTGRKVEINSFKQLKEYLNKYCCVFDLVLTNVKTLTYFDQYLSFHKCTIEGEYSVNNGRVVEAEKLMTTITNVDYEIIEKVYNWDDIYVDNFYIFDKYYLPKELVDAVLELYEKKTNLKGVIGSEYMYNYNKALLNSVYGCIVSKIDREEILYENEMWATKEGDCSKTLSKYNSNYKRFLYYPWGVFITAYARKNLWTAILSLKDDYLYADTDSVKFLNSENHLDYFVKYNELIDYKIKLSAMHFGFPVERYRPRNQKGEECPIGYWDFDGEYTRFKYLGAKRYICEFINKKGELEHKITIAGLGKGAVKYMENQGVDIFEFFNDDMVIPPDETGKLTHTYCNYEIKTKLTDLNGLESEIYEKSFIHLEKCGFTLSLSDEFLAFIKNTTYQYYT